jgi:hypothetical protein
MSGVPVATGLGWPGSDGVPSGGLGWPCAPPGSATSPTLDGRSQPDHPEETP